MGQVIQAADAANAEPADEGALHHTGPAAEQHQVRAERAQHDGPSQRSRDFWYAFRTVRAMTPRALTRTLAADRRIAALRQRGETVGAAARTDVESARADFDTRRAVLQKTNFRKLESGTGAAWDTAKAQATDGIRSLEAAVEKWASAASEKAAR